MVLVVRQSRQHWSPVWTIFTTHLGMVSRATQPQVRKKPANGTSMVSQIRIS